MLLLLGAQCYSFFVLSRGATGASGVDYPIGIGVIPVGLCTMFAFSHFFLLDSYITITVPKRSLTALAQREHQLNHRRFSLTPFKSFLLIFLTISYRSAP